MRCEKLSGAGRDPAELASELRALAPAPESVQAVVAQIIEAVRLQGDAALSEYTRVLDTRGEPPGPLVVTDEELEMARASLDPQVQDGLEQAIDNVRRVAEASLREQRIVSFGGHEVVLREAAVRSAAVYVPGGRAPYPSTVVMGVVPARVAGVGRIAVCAPPREEGDIDPTVLGACALTGASIVYRMGGAQAIAALAFGTETVGQVDVIVGPGNLYVQEAKRQLSGQVGIDGFAGPSDLLLIAGQNADPEPLALDLLAQAEHGPGTLVLGVSASSELLHALKLRIEAGPDTGAVARLIEVEDLEHALALAEAFAPEHLQLAGDAESLAARVTRAGCVFVGDAAGTAFGDYIAGSNHVLPTNGAARFASALSTSHFRRRFTEVRIGSAAAGLARAAAPVARAEGFELHARSMEARIRDNGS
jgi:histidinol dehydrogenase